MILEVCCGNLESVHAAVAGDYVFERTAGTVWQDGLYIGNGSHELFVGYQTDLNLVKKGRNLHKSVRHL